MSRCLSVRLKKSMYLECQRSPIVTDLFDRARLAKIKQDQAKDISKRAKPLGSKSRFLLESTMCGMADQMF